MSDEIEVVVGDGPEGEGGLFGEDALEIRALGSILEDEEMGREVVAYLVEETGDVVDGDAREAYLTSVEKWRRQREGRPENATKDYPWEGASNVCVPLAAQITNGIYGVLKASLGARKPFFTLKGKVAEVAGDQTEALGALINALVESKDHVNLRKKNTTIFYETASLGSQAVLVPWEIDKWGFKRKTADGGGVEDVAKVVKDCPTVVPVRPEDFITRPHWTNLQSAPWVGLRRWLYPHELKQRVAQGVYDEEAVEKVLAGGPSDVQESVEANLARHGFTVDKENAPYEVREVYLYWDVDGDGVPEDVVVWFHPESQVVLRAEFNDLGIRPWVMLGYVERPFELYGQGVGWMVEHLQDEIDALHNMRVDSMQVSMLQMYVSKRGSGIPAGLKFRPLMNLQVDTPGQDFQVVKFPDVSYGTIQAEMMAKEYADRVTGASDAMMGFESRTAGTRATASGTMFLAKQGARIVDAIVENLEEGYSQIAQILVYQLVKRKDKIDQFLPLVDAKYHAVLKNLFMNLKVEDVPNRFAFSVRTTEIDQTSEQKKQLMLMKIQLYSVFGEKIMQLAATLDNPQLPPKAKEVSMKLFEGAARMMEETLKLMDVDDTDDYIPYYRDVAMINDFIMAQKDQQVAAQGAGGGMGGGGQMGGPGAGVGMPPGGGPGGEPGVGGPGMGSGGGPVPPSPGGAGAGEAPVIG